MEGFFIVFDEMDALCVSPRLSVHLCVVSQSIETHDFQSIYVDV